MRESHREGDRNRYATVDELVHELEEVLAIEAARSGQATGEATTVLQGLSDDTADFAPTRMRHPRRTLFLSIAVLAISAAVIGFLATRAEEGPGRAATAHLPGLSTVAAVKTRGRLRPEGDGRSPRCR